MAGRAGRVLTAAAALGLMLFPLAPRSVDGSAPARRDPSHVVSQRNADRLDLEGVPGPRGSNELIVYSPGPGRDRTGTNEWGVEAVVRDGIVLEIDGNNQRLAPGGFVLSGHGTAAEWLVRSLAPGDRVELRGSSVRVERDTAAWLRRAQLGLARIDPRFMPAPTLAGSDPPALPAADDGMLGRAATHLRDGFTALGRGDYEWARQEAERAWALGLAARGQAVPAPATEARGAWVRLTSGDPRAIEATVQTAVAAGLNVLLPEVVYRGAAIYPGGPLSQHPQFRGGDPLSLLIEAAHRRGLEVHAWVHCFFIGFGDSPLAAEHPDWLEQDRTGRTSTAVEETFRYLSPAHPEARLFLLGVWRDLLSRYHLDGLQLDYIRYPDSGSDPAALFGYHPLSVGLFRAETGLDALTLTPLAAGWERWLAFRRRQVSTFVRDTSRIVRELAPDALLSAAVIADPAEARQTRGQDWGAWGEWLDYAVPMAYSYSTDQMRDLIASGRHAWDERPLIAGLGPFLGIGPETLTEQVLAARLQGTAGVMFFNLTTLDATAQRALQEGLFRTVAAPFARAR